MEGRFLLDVVVGQGAAVLELLAGEDQALLVRGDALLVLNLLLDIVNRVRGLDLKGDGLASERLHEDLQGRKEGGGGGREGGGREATEGEGRRRETAIGGSFR